MNSNNENKQLAILICVFLITSIITVIVVVLGIKSIKTSDKKDNTETKVEITEYADETTNDTNISVNKLILDTEEMIIEVLSVKPGEKNGTHGLILKTNIENNLDKRIIVEAVDEYVNNSNSNISYYFTVEKLEKLEKDMFIPVSNTDDIKLEFNINISDSLEQTLLYQSTDITIHISGKEVTVIKSSLLEDKVNSQENLDNEQNIVEDNNEVVEDNTDIVEEKPVDIDNNEQDTEEIIKNNDKQPEKEEEKTTVIGDYRYGFYTLPGEFKLTSQDGNYIEYKSSDFITVSINYRENTTINDFKIELFERYASIYPEAKFKEVDSKYVPADMILETSEIIIKNPDNEVNENTEDTEDSEQTIIQGGFTYRVYKYQVASNSGNYVMLVTTSPNKNDIVTIGILVPYDLTDYFSEFVNKVEKSYEFVQ